MQRPGIDFPGVGAGLAILRDDRILLCRRRKSPEAGHWSIVGGKVDHMEPAAVAARREAEEETGLAIGTMDFLCLTEQILADDRQHWISLIYLSRDTKGEPRLMEPEALSDLGWFSLNDLPAPLSRFAEVSIRHLRAVASGNTRSI